MVGQTVIPACPSDEQLHLHARGKLPETEADTFDYHFSVCSVCAERYDKLQSSVINAFREAAKAKPDADEIDSISSLMARVGGMFVESPSKPETLKDFGNHSSVVERGRSTVESPLHAADQMEARLLAMLHPKEQPDELGRLGGYRILKILGRGGMGAVFMAEDPRLNRLIALKVILPSEKGWDEEHKQRFLREARAAAALNHDNVIPIFEAREDDGVPYLAMPLLKGETLAERLKKEPRLPLPLIFQIIRETAQGLEAAHQAGLIHRDLKPENIWLEEYGTGIRVRILDFGLAAFVKQADSLTQSGAIMGTPHYMSPEQATAD
ncbi:MAG: serine/threonine protein kinase, partial [Planctomycetes bacterium]|nr:serine/threonine protein kinase [Planctomycetota bacterium]